MCGISGRINADPARPVNRKRLVVMNHSLRHRGPDGEGFHLAANAGLGHRRLSIIDVAGGGQPMANEDETCWIVFNGEVYNHRELRADLEAKGHRFRTQCDTEAIVHLYEELGESCVERLRGMFAFAIWDERAQTLLLARDRVGKKPLYYAETNDGIVFASRLSALLADPAVGRDVDLEAVWDYLTLQYIPAPGTIFRSARKLPPAHTLLWRASGSRLRRYWQLEYEPKLEIGEDAALELIGQKLDEAVRIRLESEVPLGCLLSGGVDSSGVVAMMRRHISGPLRTFSIGFEEETHNELEYARLVARRFETEHEEFIVRPDALEILPQVVWHADEPFADPSALPTWYLAEMTRLRVTVALTGDGGDESFAGYRRYQGYERINRYLGLPAPLRRWAIGPVAATMARLAPWLAPLEKLDYVNRLSLMEPGRAYAQFLSNLRDHQKACLAGERLRPLLERDSGRLMVDLHDRPDLRAPIDRKLHTDVMSYLPGNLLVKMDRMSMAFGLEARSPLLDHELMQVAARMPENWKLKGGMLKYLLKKALEPFLPPEVLYRPKKGFGVPLRAWFRGPLLPLLRDTLLSGKSRERGFFEPRQVEKLIDDHQHGRHNHEDRLWLLLCFETWCRTFLDRAKPWKGPIRPKPALVEAVPA